MTMFKGGIRQRIWIACQGIVWLTYLLVAASCLTGTARAETFEEATAKFDRLIQQGDFLEARDAAEEAVALARSRWGENHPSHAFASVKLAAVQVQLDDLSEAERHYRYAFETLAAEFGVESVETARVLGELGWLYLGETRITEAQALYQTAFRSLQRAGTANALEVARIQQKMAGIERNAGNAERARELYSLALKSFESELGADHPDTVESRDGLAGLHYLSGGYEEAEKLLDEGLGIREKALGPHHPDVAWSLNQIGGVLFTQRRYSEVEPLWIRALAIRKRAFGSDHRDVVTQLNNLGSLYLSMGDRDTSLRFHREAAAILKRREERVRQGSRWMTEIDRTARGVLARLVSVAWQVADEQPDKYGSLAEETFEFAQWLDQSRSSYALSQMAARLKSGEAQPSHWVRSAQWLIRTRLEEETSLVRALAGPQPDSSLIEASLRNLRLIDRVQARYDAMVARFDELPEPIAKALKEKFAAHFDNALGLAAPEPAGLVDVRAVMDDDEALVRYLVLDGATFIWVITAEGLSWVRIDAGTGQLASDVAALRLHLEPGSGRSAISLVNNARQAFDYQRAYALYEKLWAPIAPQLRGKTHVLVAPSGPLTSLPFQVLVSEPVRPELPASQAGREAQWLIRDHAVSVLPFAAALKLLRELPQATQAPEALFGVGDPDFGVCANEEESQPTQVAMADIYRGVSPDAGVLCKLEPLPESRQEVMRAAAGAGEGRRELLFGADSSEGMLKRRSEDGELAKYRVLMFATHGHVAGEINGYAEAGLSLSLPDEPTREDDGYLSASEIADLKLNADWVILSACNTAAGDRAGAEALSGLASSFFHAGARALLVSHWRVFSDSAVKLTTGTFEAMARDPAMRRAEALRQTMLAMIDHGALAEAHPSRWAPFVLIGDGR
ncbi:MAG: CHAT domain-containing protein [Rhizobiaceae bacterium]|nr:CHAT domain-containing protein [Rhizobiaceae bacterium]